MIHRIKLFAVLLLATFLFAGCAFPVIGTVGGCIRNGRICGNATNVPPVIIVPAQPVYVVQPGWVDMRGCPSGFDLTPIGWVCRDGTRRRWTGN
jgi:hypothetical protein